MTWWPCHHGSMPGQKFRSQVLNDVNWMMRCEYDVKIMMAHLITLGNDTKLYAYRDCKAAFLCHMSAFEQGDTK